MATGGSGKHSRGGDRRPEIGGVNLADHDLPRGMMVMVEGMGAAGFFRWICLLGGQTG